MNLRNAPVDKRRLKAEDRGFNTSRRETALKKLSNVGEALAYQKNKQIKTTAQAPGSGGFGLKGREIQQARLRNEGQKARRSKGLRPEKFSTPVEDPQ